jgi:hypothetical protein
MGGPNSGRKSVKGQAINVLLGVQIVLNKLLYEDFDSSMTRDELKEEVKEAWNKTKVAQEELERLNG